MSVVASVRCVCGYVFCCNLAVNSCSVTFCADDTRRIVRYTLDQRNRRLLVVCVRTTCCQYNSTVVITFSIGFIVMQCCQSEAMRLVIFDSSCVHVRTCMNFPNFQKSQNIQSNMYSEAAVTNNTTVAWTVVTTHSYIVACCFYVIDCSRCRNQYD
jgi:hypothetical protein